MKLTKEYLRKVIVETLNTEATTDASTNYTVVSMVLLPGSKSTSDNKISVSFKDNSRKLFYYEKAGDRYYVFTDYDARKRVSNSYTISAEQYLNDNIVQLKNDSLTRTLQHPLFKQIGLSKQDVKHLVSTLDMEPDTIIEKAKELGIDVVDYYKPIKNK